MMKLMPVVYVPRYLLLLLTLLCSQVGNAGPLPAVMLEDFQGARHGLAEYTGQGKWTVVMLWASDCHVCNQEASNYERFHQAHRDSDAVMLGISMDGKEKLQEARQFVGRHGVSFPNLIDQPARIAALYTQMTGRQWLGTPSFMVFAPDGELRGAQVGAVPVAVIESFLQRESGTGQAAGDKD